MIYWLVRFVTKNRFTNNVNIGLSEGLRTSFDGSIKKIFQQWIKNILIKM